MFPHIQRDGSVIVYESIGEVNLLCINLAVLEEHESLTAIIMELISADTAKSADEVTLERHVEQVCIT